VPGWGDDRKTTADCGVDDAAEGKKLNKPMPLQAKCFTEHIANMALFLGADASCHVLGANFIVDGGWV